MKPGGAVATFDRIALGGAAIACMAIAVMMICGMAARGFALPILFADEYGGYLMAALVFLALPTVTLDRKHIRASFLLDALPPLKRQWLVVFSDIILLAYAVAFIWLGWRIFATSLAGGLRSQGLMNTPMYIPQFFMVAGLFLHAISCVVKVFVSIKRAYHPEGRDTFETGDASE